MRAVDLMPLVEVIAMRFVTRCAFIAVVESIVARRTAGLRGPAFAIAATATTAASTFARSAVA